MTHRSCGSSRLRKLGALAAVVWAASTSADIGDEPVVRHGWLLVSEQEWMDVAVARTGYFRRAHDCFLAGNRREAAREIRAKATLITIESRRAVEQARIALVGCVHTLRRLAADVEAGRDVSSGKLATAFAEAETRLAEHHYLKAHELDTAGRISEMGDDIAACATHLFNASTWAEAELDRSEALAVDSARAVGVGGTAPAPAEAASPRRVLRDIGRALRRFANRGRLKPLPATDELRVGDEEQ